MPRAAARPANDPGNSRLGGVLTGQAHALGDGGRAGDRPGAALADEDPEGVRVGGVVVPLVLSVATLGGDLGGSEGPQSGAEGDRLGALGVEQDQGRTEAAARTRGGTGGAAQGLVGHLVAGGAQAHQHHRSAGHARRRRDARGGADLGRRADRTGEGGQRRGGLALQPRGDDDDTVGVLLPVGIRPVDGLCRGDADHHHVGLHGRGDRLDSGEVRGVAEDRVRGRHRALLGSWSTGCRGCRSACAGHPPTPGSGR